MIERFTAALLGMAAVTCLLPAPAIAGPTTYDMSSLLSQQHPFDSGIPLPPVVAAPVPPTQIRAPARVPQPAVPSRAATRPAAQQTEQERRPATTLSQVASTPPPHNGAKPLWGAISEIRLGALVHDEGPFSRNEEDGFDGNVEVLFVSPDFLEVIWAPRPHVGATINSVGDTSQVYAGLSWEWSFWGGVFAGFSLGGSVHDGKLETNRTDRKELGCRLLFRESVEVGYRFGGRHGISGFLDHISNANLCDRNEGLENYGIRYGYRF